MARICEITGKRTASGNNVSHANNKTRRKFYPNLHKKRFFIPEKNQWIEVKVCTSVLRSIDKNGILVVFKKAKERGTLAPKIAKLNIF